MSKRELFDHTWSDLKALADLSLPQEIPPGRTGWLITLTPKAMLSHPKKFQVDALHAEEAIDFFEEAFPDEDLDSYTVETTRIYDIPDDELEAALEGAEEFLCWYHLQDCLDELNKPKETK